MAGDGLIVADKSLILTETFRKVVRLDDGRVFGGSGDVASMVNAAKWLNAGAPADSLPTLDKEGFEGLVLESSGAVWWFDDKCLLVPYDPPCTLGAGGEIALAALRRGCSPRQAVEEAARNHGTVGGKITELKPKGKR
jgi:hypothetical protein